MAWDFEADDGRDRPEVDRLSPRPVTPDPESVRFITYPYPEPVVIQGYSPHDVFVADNVWWIDYGSELDPYAPVHRVKLEDIVNCPDGLSWRFGYDGLLFDYLNEHFDFSFEDDPWFRSLLVEAAEYAELDSDNVECHLEDKVNCCCGVPVVERRSQARECF